MILSKHAWIIVSGIKWFAIGVMLLLKGLRLITAAAEHSAIQAPLIKYFQTFASNRHQASLLIVCLGLFIGFIKGRTVLAKTVGRITSRINLHSGGLTLSQAYDRKYWIVIGVMMALGMTLRFLPVPADIHGGVDVAIGSALINGAMIYFRTILTPRKV